jgi:hypothetical protein
MMRVPDAVADEVRRLVADGLSAGQVARRVGKTRNSIIGLCHRRRWQLGDRVGSNKTLAKARAKARAKQASAGRAVAVQCRAKQLKAPLVKDGRRHAPSLPVLEPFTGRVSMMDLEHQQCRYIGERPEILTLDTPIYCGAPTDGGWWCPAHRARVFTGRIA